MSGRRSRRVAGTPTGMRGSLMSTSLGSIEKGKWGDLILTDGDPLEAKTNIKGMFIAGREGALESRHTREYEKWLKR